ncbi:MAG: alanyl-tRNA editing protein [bacterium]|nr:alanyl-tRNA editing protein [bacterium]MDE0416216.1 alanyl-tRNA editing protein [bacterium]
MERLFLDDAYRTSCQARVTSTDGGRLRLDRTVFYPNGGGQPGDSGHLELDDGTRVPIADTVKGMAMDDVVHIPEAGHPLPATGATVTAHIDWDRRYRHMRMHTALHVLCAIVDAEITGASVGAAKSRIDLNWPQPDMTREDITARLAEMAAADLPVTPRWISEEELDRRPELIRTMSIRPPRGAGMVRLLEIEGVDLQPCGGTHVARTGELAGMAVSKIENKGRHNRRINVIFTT